MDASAHRRFVGTNVEWPDDRFFVPDGGLPRFLQENLRFKVFLVSMAVFRDAYADQPVGRLSSLEMSGLRLRVLDIVRHMVCLLAAWFVQFVADFRVLSKFFASQIRHNASLDAYRAVEVPAESAWMFHLILAFLQLVGFAGDNDPVPPFVLGEAVSTEGELARSQATFFLSASITSYIEMRARGEPATLDFPPFDVRGRIHRYFAGRILPEDLSPIVVDDRAGDVRELNKIVTTRRVHSKACEYDGEHGGVPCESLVVPMDDADLAAKTAGLIAAVNTVHRVVLQTGATNRSIRVLAHRIDSDLATLSGLGRDGFLAEPGEDDGLSDSSHSSMPSLLPMSDSGDSVL